MIFVLQSHILDAENNVLSIYRGILLGQPVPGQDEAQSGTRADPPSMAAWDTLPKIARLREKAITPWQW
jgi:hypothetical protein